MEDLPKVSRVRAIIDLFEDNCRNETAQRLNKTMSKSFSGLSYIERKLKTYGTNDNNTLIQTERQLLDVSGRLKNYRVYHKERHVALQEELIKILSDLCYIESKTMMYRKKEQVEEVTELLKQLNRRLPNTAESVQQGFGDSYYQPFTHKNSKNSSLQQKVEKTPTTVLNRSYSNNSNPNSFVATSKADENDERNEPLLTPSTFKRFPYFLTGGAVGTRHPAQSIGFDATLRGNLELRRSTSEEPETRKSTGNDQYTRWTSSSLVKDRRRPVSLGGTVFTIKSADDIISSLRPSKSYERITNGEQQLIDEETTDNDDEFQGVNLLKKFFEQKSVDGEEIKKEKPLDVKENRRNEFEIYVNNLKEFDEEGQQSRSSLEGSVSSNETVIEVMVKEEDDEARSSIEVDEVEGLNTPVLRREEQDTVEKSLDDAEEDVDSHCSGQSIYLDRVD